MPYEEEDILGSDDFQDLDSDIFNKDVILFAIDCHPSMFSPCASTTEDEETVPFFKALKCVSSVFKNKIISSPDDHLGIVLFHTQKTLNSTNFSHIFLFHPLEQPDALIMQKLERIIRREIEIGEFIREPNEEEIPMGNVFWTCSSLLSQSIKNSTKRIFLFTNQDNPHSANPSLKRAAKTRARDLADLGIEMILFPLDSSLNRKFDMYHFYRDIICDEGENVERFPNISEKLSELNLRVRRKEAKRRALKRTFINVGPELALSVRLYGLLQEVKKDSQFVWIESDTNTIFYPKTQWFSVESGAPLPKQEINLSFNYGGKQVLFSPAEVAELKSFGEPGISLICFVPRAKIKFIEHHLNKTTFIFPDESQTKGSSVLFLSLCQELSEKGNVAICRYIARRGVSPRLVALVPQVEQTDESGYLVTCLGFHLFPLPFAEEIRHLSFDSPSDLHQPAGLEAIDKAKEIISKLMLVYEPENYENPSIQKFYTYLQALALDEEDVESIEDSTHPDFELIEKRAGLLMDQLKEMNTVEKDLIDQKRKVKRAKVADIDDSFIEQNATNENEIDFEKMTAEDSLNQLTVNDLKTFLASVDQKPKRLKAELIEQVKEYFSTKIEID